jgi:FkbM family methyltransferase
MIIRIKFFIRRLLCNYITGHIIKKIYKGGIPDMRWKGYRFQIPEFGVSNTNIAALFWGFYESAEIRLIQKYLSGNTDVIELGGSIGIVSGHLSSKMQPGKRLLTIEANPALVNSIKINSSKFASSGVQCEVLNYAIDYAGTSIELYVTDDNTESRVGGTGKQGKAVRVNSITLKKIIEKYGITEYTLVCDIEGGEIQLLLEDPTAFENCTSLIIELHDVWYKEVKYRADEILNLFITKLGYTLVEKDGHVCFFKKR